MSSLFVLASKSCMILFVYSFSDVESNQIVTDEKLDKIKDEEIMISRVVSPRDMATKMRSEGSSSHSSPRERFSFCHSPPPILPHSAVENNDHPSKLDIREVQIDKRATMTNWFKRQIVTSETNNDV